jgi:hypothetical protein
VTAVAARILTINLDLMNVSLGPQFLPGVLPASGPAPAEAG